MKSYHLFMAFLIAGLAVPAFAQKDDDNGRVGIFQSRAEYEQFIGGAKRTAYGPNGSPELRAMIPMLNDIALNQPIGATANKYNADASTLGLLADKNIRADLEMVDDQYEELKRLNSEIQNRMADQIRGLDFGDTENLASRIRAMSQQSQNDLNSVLLPHQVTRLRQIRMQSQLRRRSLVDILTSDPLKSELVITDRQSDELRQEEKEIEEDLAREIAKLREKARDRLLSKLKPNQKAQVKEMLGDAFDFSKSSYAKSDKGNSKRN